MLAVGFEACTVSQYNVGGSPVVVGVGDVRQRQFPVRVTDSLALVANTGPPSTIVANGRTFVVGSGEVIFRPPHAIWGIMPGEVGFTSINIDRHLLPNGARYAPFSCRPASAMPAVQDFVQAIRDAGSSRARAHTVSRLVETLFAVGLARPGERSEGAPSSARRARELIERHYRTPLLLDEIAEAIDTTRFALLRHFRRSYGITPHAFQVRLQVRDAQRLLAAGATPKDVASTVGFADPSHLGRHFRRILGVTPGAYARLCRNPQFRSKG